MGWLVDIMVVFMSVFIQRIFKNKYGWRLADLIGTFELGTAKSGKKRLVNWLRL